VITVVLPAYNEAEALPPLLERLRAVSAGHFGSSLSVIVVDDGSSDGTAEAARTAAPGLAVRVVSHPANRGLNEAIRSGLLAALEQVGDDDIVVTMDADDTHAPGLILRMARMIAEGCDVVIASRYQPGSRTVGVPWRRRALSRGASWIFRVLFPIRGVKDYTCGYRAYRAAVIQQALHEHGDAFLDQDGFQCMVDILLKLRRHRLVFGEVPLILRYDFKEGATKMRLGRTIASTLALIGRSWMRE
jgi:dolichol-phosphate mannosyltransferase